MASKKAKAKSAGGEPAFDEAASERVLMACGGIASLASTAVEQATYAATPFLSFAQRSRIRALSVNFESGGSPVVVHTSAAPRPATVVTSGEGGLSREEIDAIVAHRVEIAVTEALQRMGVSPDSTIAEQVDGRIGAQVAEQENRILDYVRGQLTDSLRVFDDRLELRLGDLESAQQSAEVDEQLEQAREDLLKEIDEVRTVDVGVDQYAFAAGIVEVDRTTSTEPTVTEAVEVEAGAGEAIEAGDGEAIEVGDGEAIEVGDGEAIEVGDGEAIEVGDGEAIEVGDGEAIEAGDDEAVEVEAAPAEAEEVEAEIELGDGADDVAIEVGDGEALVELGADDLSVAADDDLVELADESVELTAVGPEDASGADGATEELVELQPDAIGGEDVQAGELEEVDVGVELEIAPEEDDAAAQVIQQEEEEEYDLGLDFGDGPQDDEEHATTEAAGDIELAVDDGDLEEIGGEDVELASADGEELEEISLIQPMPEGVDVGIGDGESIDLDESAISDIGENDVGLMTLGEGPDEIVVPDEDEDEASDDETEIEVEVEIDVEEELEDADPENDVDGRTAIITKYMDRALQMGARQQFTPALELYSKVLDLDPNHFDALVSRGVIYSKTKDYRKATEDFRRGQEIAPERAGSYYGLAELHYNRRQFNKAIKNYNLALERDDQLAEAYCRRGLSYYYLKNYKVAFHDLYKAYDINPDLPKIRSFLKLVQNKIKESEG